MLVFFIVLGEFFLDALDISLVSFRISGSIILFLFALTMIFETAGPVSNSKESIPEEQNIAIFPLAVPAIAGPGSMLAVVVLTDNNRFSIFEQAITTTSVIVVLAIQLLLLLLANPIYKVIRKSGTSIVSKVMGMMLAAIAVDGFLTGLEQRLLQ